MFKSLLEAHNDAQSKRKDDADASRREAFHALDAMNDALADAVSGDVHDVFEAQKKIEERSRELREKSVRFASVTGEWTRFLNNFDDALRGIGDFERWVKEVEFDLNNLTGVMKYVEEGAEEERGGADAGDEDGNE